MAAISLQAIGQNSTIKANPNTTIFQVFGKYTHEGGGPYDTLGLIQKSFEALVMSGSRLGLSSERITDLNSVANWISSARSPLIIFKISSYTGQKFSTSFWSCWSGVEGFLSRRGWTLLYDTLDVGLDFITFGLLFRMSKVAKTALSRISNIGYLTMHFWDMKQGCQKFQENNAIIFNASQVANLEHRDEINTFLSENKKYCMLKIALSVANFVKDIAIFAKLVGYECFVPAVPFWVLGTAVLVLRFSKEFYADSMTYIKNDQR